MTMTNYLLVTQHGQLKRVLDSLGIKNTDGYTEDGTQIEANLGEHIVRFSFKTGRAKSLRTLKCCRHPPV